MKSIDLSNEGFVSWNKFSLKNEISLKRLLSKEPGVYIIKTSNLFGRFVGQSDIVYIGSATNIRGLRGRIQQHYHPGPTQSTNLRINSMMQSRDDLFLASAICLTTREAKEREKHLLALYEVDHSELPPLNRRV